MIARDAAPDSRVPMALVFANITRNRGRLLIALTGVAFAVFLMVFQTGLLVGFVQASQRMIVRADGRIWILPRGLPCFDLPGRMPRRFADLARQVPGIRGVAEVAGGITIMVRPDGVRRAVLVVGADRDFGAFPFPDDEDGVGVPEGVVVDRSNAWTLGVSDASVEIEIADRRATALHQISGFGSFLGSPYVFSSYRDARRLLRFDAEETSFVIVQTEPGADETAVVAALRRRLPEADVLTREEFAFRSARYWVVQTGAGGAILVAALVGFLIGLVITSQTMYATAMEQLDEFATLKAIGASGATVARLVLWQSVLIGVTGAILGLLLTAPLVRLAREYIVSWVDTPNWLLLSAPVAGVTMCCLGSLASVRRVVSVDPVLVLRR